MDESDDCMLRTMMYMENEEGFRRIYKLIPKLWVSAVVCCWWTHSHHQGCCFTAMVDDDWINTKNYCKTTNHPKWSPFEKKKDNDSLERRTSIPVLFQLHFGNWVRRDKGVPVVTDSRREASAEMVFSQEQQQRQLIGNLSQLVTFLI